MQAVLWLLQLAARRHRLVAPRRCLLAVVLPAVAVLVSRVAKAVTREWAVCYSSTVVVVRRVAAAPLHLNLRRVRKRAAYRSTLASRQRAAAAPCQYQLALPWVVLPVPFVFVVVTVMVHVVPVSSSLRQVVLLRLRRGRAQLVAV